MKKRIFCLLLAATALLFAACGKSEAQPYPESHEHVFGAAYVATPATCQQEGETVRYCKICHEELVRPYSDPDAHDFADTVIPPTEKEEGYTVRVCRLCGEILSHEAVVPARYDLIETDATDTTLPQGVTALLLSDTATHTLYRAAGGQTAVDAALYRRLAVALTVGEVLTAGNGSAELLRQLHLYVYDGRIAAVTECYALLNTTEADLLTRVNARMETLGVTGASLTSLTAAEHFGTATLAATARVFARALDEPTVAAALAAAVPPVKAVAGYETRAVLEAPGLYLSAVVCGAQTAFLLLAAADGEAVAPALYASLPAAETFQ